MSKILYLMRHGQTLFNVRRKIQGWCDAPLTELGIKQAQVAANYFKERTIVFDHAYASTSERACDTLEYITDLPYTRVKGLKEWNFGMFEGESEDLNPSLPYKNFFKAYGGEGEEEFRARISNTLIDIMDRDNHDTVLAVSHGAACAQFFLEWQHYGEVVIKERIHNCCILKYQYNKGIFSLLELNNQDFSQL